jgi:hypothetical protein
LMWGLLWTLDIYSILVDLPRRLIRTSNPDS